MTCAPFHLLNPSREPSHTLPSLAARTDHGGALGSPSFVEIVRTARSRKRSRPFFVATQILPSRSSKSLVTKSPDRPLACVNASVLPPCTCKRPRSKVPIQRPPSRSRISLCGLNRGTGLGSWYALPLPSANALMPSCVATKSVPGPASIRDCDVATIADTVG